MDHQTREDCPNAAGGGSIATAVSAAGSDTLSDVISERSADQTGRRTFTRAEKRGMLREAVNMAWPAVLESFFTSLAGMIDTMMVSSMGSYAVAAVGLTNLIIPQE